MKHAIRQTICGVLLVWLIVFVVLVRADLRLIRWDDE